MVILDFKSTINLLLRSKLINFKLSSSTITQSLLIISSSNLDKFNSIPLLFSEYFKLFLFPALPPAKIVKSDEFL